MASRTKAREQALQILYLIDICEMPVEKALDLFRVNFQNQPDDLSFARQLVEGVTTRRKELDEQIEKCSDHWRIHRMPRIDRNILRLGAYEIEYSPDVPHAVSMDEAIELGKKYGEEQTAAFINGILDRIAKQMGSDEK